VITGTTGLIGQSTLQSAVLNKKFSYVYSLSRRAIETESDKVIQWIDPELTPPALNKIQQVPSIGVIALGTTIKKAGSKEQLKAVDTTLVIQVAKKLQQIGVKHLFVISSLGASIKAFSHYLRCKGEMEMTIQQLDFNSITFLQPGPLAGFRKEVRKDEQILQRVMKIFNPFMRGRLANFKPIQSQHVAEAIIHLAIQNSKKHKGKVKRINSSGMEKLLNKSSLSK
jgi:uncharacterized protein YbjT (DUF2867 family)